MVIILALLIALVIVLLGLVIKVLILMHHNRIEEFSTFLQKFVKIILVLTIFGYFLGQFLAIIAYFSDGYSALMQSSRAVYPVLLSLRLVFEVSFYIAIMLWADKLLGNLKINKIFHIDNTKYTKKIGMAFLILFVAEVTTGLLINIAHFASVGGTFELTTSPKMFMYLIIGFILLIVSSLFENSIKIYEENQLTI
ncbi:MAG: DUF2975 domain-containing protein [Tenericutes bacterium]|nr:DUF2975 domain-containing protein [Mycoplasmatota bacterium]